MDSCLFEREWDPVIAGAISTSDLCRTEYQRLREWTKANNEAFRSIEKSLRPDWKSRTKKGEKLALIFESFLNELNLQKDWSTRQSPWNKMKYIPEILKASDTVPWPDLKEFEREYLRLDIDFMGRPEATNLKVAINLALGDETPSVFYHDLTLPTNAIKIPDGPWKRGDQTIRYWHNGYSFGGRRLEGDIELLLDNGPEDCSSYIAKLLKLNPDEYTADSIKDLLTKEGQEITIRDPKKDIQPGQIICLPGHIALSFGLIKPGELLLLEYNRDRETLKIEGFGFRKISIQQKQNTWVLTNNSEKALRFFLPKK